MWRRREDAIIGGDGPNPDIHEALEHKRAVKECG
jgi:hypothetical protein